MTEATSSEENVAKEDGVISAKSLKTGKEATVKKDFGDNLQAAIQLFGEEEIHAIFKQQAVIKCQARMRGILDKGGSEEEAVAAGENYVPCIVTRRAAVSKDPVAQLAQKVKAGDMTVEDLQNMLKEALAD